MENRATIVLQQRGAQRRRPTPYSASSSLSLCSLHPRSYTPFVRATLTLNEHSHDTPSSSLACRSAVHPGPHLCGLPGDHRDSRRVLVEARDLEVECTSVVATGQGVGRCCHAGQVRHALFCTRKQGWAASLNDMRRTLTELTPFKQFAVHLRFGYHRARSRLLSERDCMFGRHLGKLLKGATVTRCSRAASIVVHSVLCHIKGCHLPFLEYVHLTACYSQDFALTLACSQWSAYISSTRTPRRVRQVDSNHLGTSPVCSCSSCGLVWPSS